MITLEINKIQAVIADNFTYKLIEENTMLTESGNYTLEIELPLNEPNNNRIFSSLTIYNVHDFENMEAFLKDERKIILWGKVKITSITEEKIKIQIIASNALLTSDNYESIYIDELNLGMAYEKEVKKYLGINEEANVDNVLKMLYKRYVITDDKDAGTDKDPLRFGDCNETDFVCFPIYSQVDKKWANNFVNVQIIDKDTIIRRGCYFFKHKNKTSVDLEENIWKFAQEESFAPQPYISTIVERILKEIGYECEYNWLRDKNNWMSGIFLANVKNTTKITEMLPHWTIKDFFKELENLFSITIKINGKTKKSRIESNSFQNLSVINLENVLDEYEVSYNDEENKNSTATANVKFDFEDEIDNFELLPESIYEQANFLEFENREKIYEKAKNMESEELYNTVFIDKSQNRSYIRNNEEFTGWNGLKEVDGLGMSRNNSSKEADVTLKMIPVGQTDEKKDYFQELREVRSGYFVESDDAPKKIWTGMLSSMYSRTSTIVEKMNVFEYLNNEEEKEEKDIDKMEMALNIKTLLNYRTGKDDNNFAEITMRGAMGRGYYACENRIFCNPFSLKRKGCVDRSNNEEVENVGKSFVSIKDRINSKTEIEVSFTDDKEISANAIYYICGKKYIAKKIERSIKNGEIEKLVKGTFYPIN